MSKSKASLVLLVVFSVALAGSRAVSGSNELRKPATKENYTRAAVDLALNKASSRGRGLRTLSLNVERRGHTATALADGRVLIAGGENENGPVAEIEAIDPRSSQVNVVAALETARGGHSATTLQDGRVIIIGGSSGSSALRSTEIFDPATLSISSGPRLSFARSGHTATLLGDGQLLVVGGDKNASAEIFNPETGKFSVLPGHLLEARHHHGAALLKDGTVLIAGGVGKDGKALDSAEVFNPANSQFEAIVGWMGAKRINPAFNQLPDGKVQVIGGDEAGTMEMYTPEGRFFRSKATLALTAEMLPAEALLLSRTRSAYLDGLFSSRKKSQAQQGVESQAATSHIPLDLHGYSATETAGRDFAVIAGGVDAQGRIVRSVLVTENTTDAAITTDRIDYTRQQSPVISGSGWTPGESILIVRQASIKPFGRTILRGKADAAGNFSNSELIPADHQVGSYILTAVGERSGFVAQTTYRTAPTVNPNAKYPNKPTKITFEIPLDGKAGSTETEVGTLRWKPKASEGTIAPQNIGGDGAVSLDACLSFGPVSLCGGAVEMEVLNSDFQFSISAKGVFALDFGDILTGRLASFELGFEITETLDANLLFEITGSGSLEVSGVVVSFFPPIEFDLADILEGELSAGLKVGVNLTLEPTTIQVAFTASQSHTIGASVSTATGFAGINQANRDAVFTGGVTVINLGKACLNVFVGPSVEVSLSIADVIGGSLEGLVAGLVEGCVTPTMNSTCEKYEVTIDGAVKANIAGSIEFFEAGFGGELTIELFRVNIYKTTVVASDTGPPVFTSGVSNMQTTTDAGNCSAVVSYSAVAEDSCSGLQSVNCQPPSDSTFPKGVTTVTCTATDKEGNSANASFNVTVQDSEQPVFAATPSYTRSTDPGQCSAVVNYAVPQATDNCPGVTSSCQPPTGTTFAKGVTTVDCTATDASLNAAAVSFTVTVNDTEKPTVNATSVLAFAVPGTFSTVVNFSAQVTDNCPGLQVLYQPPSGSVFPAGSTLVTGTATDAAGNVSEFSFTVTVYNIIAVDERSGGIFRAAWDGGPTAQYEYYDCRKGVNIAGTMSMSTSFCKIEGSDLGPDPKDPDRDVYILFNFCTFRADGRAEFGGTPHDFTDLDVRNSPVACP